MWTHAVTDASMSQPDLAVRRLRFIEAARAALRRDATTTTMKEK
jgi:hypothetical protein